MATAADILDALIVRSDDKIWASELAFFEGGSSRIDFWTLEPVGGKTAYRASAYEIKVSRADFRRESDDKQCDALRWSDRFWYVAPPDVIPPQELPAWAGLQTWDGTTFCVVKKAPEIAALRFQVERDERHRKQRQKSQFDRWLRANRETGG